MYSIGSDVGSTYTKYCILNHDGEIVKLFSQKTPVAQKKYFLAQAAHFYGEYLDCQIISCGYGRKNIESQKAVSELTALAVGANRQYPTEKVILDIGGQDTKIIRQENGKLKEFFINDKCAAGCGMFLKNTLEMLEMDFETIDLLSDFTQRDLRISSVCAVFAQTEIVEAIAGDVPAESIIRAVLYQIFTKAKVLLGKIESNSILLSGGLAGIIGIKPFAEQILGRSIFIPDNAQYLSAIGCAELCSQYRRREL